MRRVLSDSLTNKGRLSLGKYQDFVGIALD
jgi:hypothetical protein